MSPASQSAKIAPLESEQQMVKSTVNSIMDEMVRLTRLYCGNKSTTLIASALRSDVFEQLKVGRLHLLSHLLEGDLQSSMLALSHPLLQDLNTLRSIGLLNQPLEAAEAAVIDQVRHNMTLGWRYPAFLKMLAISYLYFRPWDVPFISEGIEALSRETGMARAYLYFFMHESVTLQLDDDQEAISHLEKMMTWCAEQVGQIAEPPITERTRWVVEVILPNMNVFSINQTIFSIHNALPAVKARARLIKALNMFQEFIQGYQIEPFTRKVAPVKGRKVRIGYLVRTIAQGPDTQVILAEIGRFDLEKVEIYFYTRDVMDFGYQHNATFYRRLFNVVSEVRSVAHQTISQLVKKIREDNLDLFIASDGANYAFDILNLLSFYRMAPVQIFPNRPMSVSSGLDSFDFFVTAKTPEGTIPQIEGQTSEEVRQVPGALIAYDRGQSQAPENIITREMLGIEKEDIMMLCGAAASKLVPACCDTFIRILSLVPRAKLVLVPFSYSWGGQGLQPLLETRLSIALKKYNVSRDRIIMTKELLPQDVPQVPAMADIYLNQWPVGGSTWLTQCMSVELPIVVMDTVRLNGIGDQSIMRDAGFDDLVAKDEEAYVQLAVDLANDPDKRESVRKRLRNAHDTMPHNDLVSFSTQLQSFYIGLVDEVAHRSESL